MPSPTNRLPSHRGLELAASYRERLVCEGVLTHIDDPVSDDILGGLLRSQGIMVARLALSEKVQAIYMRSDSLVLVIVNRMDTIGRQRFSLAHELCHHMFHGDLNTWICSASGTNRNDHEKEADEFASAFLLPANGVGARYARLLCERHEIERAVMDICLHCGTSWQNAVYRLSDLGLISRQQKGYLEGQKPRALAKRYNVPCELFGRYPKAQLPTEFADIAQNLLERDIISQRKFEGVLESLESLLACDRAGGELAGAGAKGCP